MHYTVYTAYIHCWQAQKPFRRWIIWHGGMFTLRWFWKALRNNYHALHTESMTLLMWRVIHEEKYLLKVPEYLWIEAKGRRWFNESLGELQCAFGWRESTDNWVIITLIICNIADSVILLIQILFWLHLQFWFCSIICFLFPGSNFSDHL